MFLLLFAVQFFLVSANPFHKYPYVFLLDIGNEELEKTNTEQIRLTVPGGSLALRYPAIGDGDTIAHVRVSGIDFGTDLKANIVDGGPGSKYVVIVFNGNPGVPYDAVMTIQTVSDADIDLSDEKTGLTNDLDVANDSAEITDVSNTIDGTDETDQNNSSEDTSEKDDIQTQKANDKLQISEESSHIYNYVNKDNELDDKNGDDDNNENSDNANDENEENSEKDQSVEADPIDSNDNIEIKSADEIKADNDEDINNYDGDASKIQSSDLYDQYVGLQPNLYGDVKVYPQNAIPFAVPDSTGYNPEDSIEFDQTFNDEDNHSQSNKVKESNNNFDNDDTEAIDY